ncbi:hypothetical protein [Vibrio cholerae]|uniref:hypothetical protein n=1 Tax=Vibrio cholerae TaxID=666 RepID=UPI003CC81ADE
MLWASGNDWDRGWIQQVVDLLVGHGAFTLYPALSQWRECSRTFNPLADLSVTAR